MHYIILLDTSWSMKFHMTKLMIGINNLIKSISYNREDDYITIATFSDNIKYLYVYKRCSEIPHISEEALGTNYGGTALYDSIGQILIEFNNIETVKTLYIISDGDDSSSSRFTQDQISEQCKTYETSGEWSIIHCSTCVSKLEIRKRYSFNIDHLAEIFNTLGVANK